MSTAINEMSKALFSLIAVDAKHILKMFFCPMQAVFAVFLVIANKSSLLASKPEKRPKFVSIPAMKVILSPETEQINFSLAHCYLFL